MYLREDDELSDSKILNAHLYPQHFPSVISFFVILLQFAWYILRARDAKRACRQETQLRQKQHGHQCEIKEKRCRKKCFCSGRNCLQLSELYLPATSQAGLGHSRPPSHTRPRGCSPGKESTSVGASGTVVPSAKSRKSQHTTSSQTRVRKA